MILHGISMLCYPSVQAESFAGFDKPLLVLVSVSARIFTEGSNVQSSHCGGDVYVVGSFFRQDFAPPSGKGTFDRTAEHSYRQVS